MTSTSRSRQAGLFAQPVRTARSSGRSKPARPRQADLDRGRLEPGRRRTRRRSPRRAPDARPPVPTALAFDGPATPAADHAYLPASASQATVDVPPPSTPRDASSSNDRHEPGLPPAASTAARTWPPWACRRASASSGSTPAIAITSAGLSRPPHRERSRGRSSSSTPGQLAEHPAGPDPQLLVRRLQVDHPVAQRLADPDHRPGGDHVQDHLGGRARLEPGRAGDDLGADQRGDLDVDRARRAGSGGCRRCRRSPRPAAWPRRRRPAHRASGPRWRCRRRGRPAPTPMAARSSAPRSGSSSAPSMARVECGGSAGDQADDHLRRRAERRRAFGGVEHAQPARGPAPT